MDRKSRTVRFLDFDHPRPQRVDRHSAVPGARVEEARHPRRRRVRQRPAAGGHRVQEPTIGDAWKAEAVKQLRRYQEADTTWKDQGAPKLFEAAQILVGTCGERAVYGTVGTPERFFLEWKEPYPLSVKQLGERLGRAPTPQDVLLYGLLEPRNVLDVVRNFVVFEVRRRPHRPQADPLQAVHRRQRGAAADPEGAETERAGRHRLAHAGVGQEPDDAVAGAQAAPRRGAAAADRGHRHRPHEARPANRRRVHRVRVPQPRAGG